MEEIQINQLKQKLELQRDETMQFLRRLEQEACSLDADTTQRGPVRHQCVKGGFVRANEPAKDRFAFD